jgi:hypothetical protein
MNLTPKTGVSMKTIFESFFAEAKSYGVDTIDQYPQEYKGSISRGIRYWSGTRAIRDTLVKKYKEKYPEYNFYITPQEKGWISVTIEN